MKVLLITLLITLAGCGSSQTTIESSSKSLFDLWVTDDGAVLDLRAGQIGVDFDIILTLTDESTCNIVVHITGDGFNGTFSVGAEDCGGVLDDGDYAISDNTLTICDSSGCSEFR